jgi:hypothetical protein
MTAATRIFGSIFTSRTFFGGSSALCSSSSGLLSSSCFAAIRPHPAVVYFAHTTIRLTSIAFLAKQLNVRCLVAASTRKGRDVIIF